MPSSNNDKSFSNNEVATLVESFKNDIAAVAEGVTSLREDVNILKEDMTEVKTDLATIKDAVRISIPSLNIRLTKLEAKVGS